MCAIWNKTSQLHSVQNSLEYLYVHFPFPLLALKNILDSWVETTMAVPIIFNSGAAAHISESAGSKRPHWARHTTATGCSSFWPAETSCVGSAPAPFVHRWLSSSEQETDLAQVLCVSTAWAPDLDARTWSDPWTISTNYVMDRGFGILLPAVFKTTTIVNCDRRKHTWGYTVKQRLRLTWADSKHI